MGAIYLVYSRAGMITWFFFYFYFYFFKFFFLPSIICKWDLLEWVSDGRDQIGDSPPPRRRPDWKRRGVYYDGEISRSVTAAAAATYTLPTKYSRGRAHLQYVQYVYKKRKKERKKKAYIAPLVKVYMTVEGHAYTSMCILMWSTCTVDQKETLWPVPVTGAEMM